ncbi:fibronectin type III domain-containing protein [Paenibacillus solanacearum]|nr:fibronectin type III domain-containing protein [Paenibacillus solanacearum]
MLSIAVLAAVSFGLWRTWGGSMNKGGEAEITAAPFQTDEAHAVIDIDTKREKSIPYGMRGVNNETSNKEAFINHSQMIDEVNRYGRLGFIRWPGGTNSDVFNWRTGMPDIDYGAFAFGPDGTTHGPHTTFRLGQVKGGEHIADYIELLRKTNTKAMITVNTTRQTAEQAGDLAKYLYDNRVPVIYFELGNEIMFFTSSSGKSTPYYKTAADYLDKVRGHYEAIKRNYPGAKVIISMANSNKPEMANAFDKDVFAYPDPYWDGITFHRFEGDGKTVPEAMKSANSALEKLVPLIDTNYVPKFQNRNTPIYLGEQGVALGGILESTQYHGIYVAESILRLSAQPNITYLAGYRLHNGIFNTNAVRGGTNVSLLMEDAYQRGETVDPALLSYDSYYHASSASLRVVDGAVNYSSAVWPAQVTGGAESTKTGGSMPALYAAAYKGENGTRYLVVTNKSAQSQQISVRMDGKPVQAEMRKTYTTANDPAARNTAMQKEQVAIRSESTANPVTVAPYSVTRLEWSGAAPDAPREAWLYAAEPGSGGTVDLRWYSTTNATGYKIKYGTASKTYTQTIDAGQALEYKVSGLTEGRTYYFAVAAYNGSGESPASNETVAALSVPGIPVLRHAYAERSGKVVLEWQPVAGADGYRIAYGKAPGQYTGTIEAGNNAGWLVSGLDNDTRYYFAVRAYNALGESRNSAELDAVPRRLLPLAPRDLAIKQESGPSITMQWKPARTEVAEHNFEDGTAGPFRAEGWKVEPHPDRNRKVSGYRAQAGGGAFAVWTDTPQGQYEGEALVEWTDGTAGQAGVAARYVDRDNHIRFVYDRADKQYKLIKVTEGKEQVLASKKESGNPKRLYLFITVDGNNIYAKLNNEGTILRATDSSLPSGKFALYSSGPGAWFDTARMYAPNTKSYTVYRSTKPDAGFEAIAEGVAETAYTDSGLPEGQRYYYKVQAVNEQGESVTFSNVIRKN